MKNLGLSSPDFWAMVFLVILIIFFFGWQLFWPINEPKILATPDFDRSDLWHLNFALKDFLSKTLKKGEFPLWTDQIGRGFPVLAEGQIGTFHLYNLWAFRLLPSSLAFNLGFLTIFLTTGLSTYLYGRAKKLRPTASLFSALALTFSFVFVGHLTHFNLIQAASMLPGLFLATEKMLQYSKKREVDGLIIWGTIFSFLLSQQIFSGFPQLVLYSVTSLIIYLLFSLKFLSPRRAFFLILWFLFFIILGLLTSAIQLFPQAELLKESGRFQGVGVFELARFPLHPKNLLNFFSPYANGDPRLGTYPAFTQNWGVFWESTGYFGVLALIFFLLGSVNVWLTKDQKVKGFKNLASVNLLALVLMLGRYTPFFFLFQIPPWSLFPVPARFLFIFVLTASVLAGYFLDRLGRRPLGLLAILILIVDLFFYGLNYHLTVPLEKFLKTPQTAEFILTEKRLGEEETRLFTPASHLSWNEVFLKKGWLSQADHYLYLRNSLDQNLNLIYNLAHINHYESITTKRTNLWRGLTDSGLGLDEENKSLSLAKETKRILDLSGTNFLVTTFDLKEPNWPLVKTIDGQPPYFIYENKEAFPKAWLATEFVTVETVEELLRKMVEEKIDLKKTVILEKPRLPPEILRKFKRRSPENFVEIKEYKNQRKVFRVSTAQESFLVVNQQFYPGWTAKINGEKTEVMPANLNQEAVFIPAGEHEVVLEYRPKSFYLGLSVSVISFSILILLFSRSLRRQKFSG